MRGWLVLAGAAGAVAAVAAAAVALSFGSPVEHPRELRVGDCVTVSPNASGVLHSSPVACDTDVSVTVAALAGPADDCNKYERFRSNASA